VKITEDFLQQKSACGEGVKWFINQKETEDIKVVAKLIKEDSLDWANWLIARCMKYKQYVSYAVFAAEQVIDIYEKKYPDNKAPRKAIEAAKKCIETPSKANKKAAYAAANAAYAAANAAYAAANAAAANAAYAAAANAAYAAAANAAHAAAYAAHAAYAAANAAAAYAAAIAAAANAAYAAYAAAYAGKKMRIRILEYGIGLLKEGILK